MPNIQHLGRIEHSDLAGVSVFPIDGGAEVGTPQNVLVLLMPEGEIPLHTHEVDATMIIVGGGGQVLSDDPSMHGEPVWPGMVVFFERRVAHGFRAGAEGLSFVSRNGGIVDHEEGKWDIEFT